MLKHISKFICALAIGSGLAFGVVGGTACDDDDDDGGTGFGGAGGTGAVTGRAGSGGGGTGGRGGTSGGGTSGGGTSGGGTTGTTDGGAPTGDASGMMTYNVPLMGAEEVPPVPTTATGTSTVTLDPGTGMVTVTGNYSGLTSNANAAHIHGPAMPGMNAPILIPLTFGTGTSGNLSGSGTLTPAQVQDMLMGRMYVNVHSVNYPMGEIRGQVD